MKGFYNSLKVTYPRIEGEVIAEPIRKARTSLVEPNHCVIGGQFLPPMTPNWTLPREFQVGQPVWGFYQRRAVSHGRIEDAHAVGRCAKPEFLVSH
jgi:hypothetical protein